MTLRARLRTRRASFSLDVELEIPAGVTVLFGPSGAGKSTTLSLLAGLQTPDEGRVSLGDSVWLDTSAGIAVPVHTRRLSYVFQSLALFPHMTAQKNVEYGIDRRLPRDERSARARAALDRMQALFLADRMPATFSGGEAQRVALARALAPIPELLLLDEPFSALDEPLRHELGAELLAQVDKMEIPTILVTHHPGDARALGRRVVVLRAGRVVEAGSVESSSLAITGAARTHDV